MEHCQYFVIQTVKNIDNWGLPADNVQPPLERQGLVWLRRVKSLVRIRTDGPHLARTEFPESVPARYDVGLLKKSDSMP